MTQAPPIWRNSRIYSFLLRFGVIVWSITRVIAFNPYQYSKKTAECVALRRTPFPEEVKLNLSYVEVNQGRSLNTILLVHGWPAMWSTWSKQIEALQDEYHLVVPDLRGFGYSSHPEDFKSSHTMGDLVHDLTCILDDAHVSAAVCMGHDWGSQTCYQAARMRPDIFIGVIGLVVPYIPSAGPYVSVKELVPAFPRLAYQGFFDGQTEEAANELNQDIRRTLRATMRTVASPPPADFLTSNESFLRSWGAVQEIPPIPFFSREEENYLVELFSRQGFLYTLGFYTEENRYQSWAFDDGQGNLTLPQPVLSILPTEDPVADWKLAMDMLNSDHFLPNLMVKYVEGAHWVHLENPEPVNEAIKQWLKNLRSRTFGAHVVDEL